MIKLRDILAESEQAIINEGTRWMVGVEGRNGRISATYGHYDGYPEHTGKLLKKFYKLLGYCSILFVLYISNSLFTLFNIMLILFNIIFLLL